MKRRGVDAATIAVVALVVTVVCAVVLSGAMSPDGDGAGPLGFLLYSVLIVVLAGASLALIPRRWWKRWARPQRSWPFYYRLRWYDKDWPGAGEEKRPRKKPKKDA